MKKTNMKKKLVLILVLLLLTTGCTKTLTDSKNKPVKNEKTGQSLTANILCKPTNKSNIKLYKENKVKIEKLPECDKFKITSGKYEGLWTTFFVKPLAFILLRLGKMIGNYAVSLIIVSLIIRLIAFPFTKKTAMQSELMKKAQPEITKIQNKYKDKQDQESMTKQSQEMMMVYKKYKISPFGSCLLAFIQLPLFFAFLQAINRTPAIFEDTFLGLILGRTPMVGLFTYHQWLYIVIILLIIGTTYFSFKNAMKTSNSGNPEMDKQMNFMFKFMIIMISVASLYLSTAIALYWIATNAFVVLQNFIFKKLDEKGDKKEIIIKPKKEKKDNKKELKKRGK